MNVNAHLTELKDCQVNFIMCVYANTVEYGLFVFVTQTDKQTLFCGAGACHRTPRL